MYNYDFKINLFADDVLLTISRTEESVPHLLKLISDFGIFSGYKINWCKSEGIPLNTLTYSSILNNTSIEWKPQDMKYLGIIIKSPIDNIIELNFSKIFKTIKEDLKIWSALPLSLWGRGEILKMNELPLLSFLFSSIPLKIPQRWFNDMNKCISVFLWQGKKPKINLKKLSVTRAQGGLGIPDLYLYYFAHNCQYPLSWAYKTDPPEPGSWRWLEQEIVKDKSKSKNVSLASLWYEPKPDKCIKNSLIIFSCEVAKILQRLLHITGISLPSCPIWKNPSFMAGNAPLTNIFWESRKITCFGQVVRDGEKIPFQELKTEFNLENSCIFQYIQLESILSTNIFQNMEEPLDSQLKRVTTGRRTVSKVYNMLCPVIFDCNRSILDQWERDLGLRLTTDQWEGILKRTSYLSKCVRYKMIQFKILHKIYNTPHKLNKINSNVSNKCWHECGKSGTLVHMLWFCPEVKKKYL